MVQAELLEGMWRSGGSGVGGGEWRRSPFENTSVLPVESFFLTASARVAGIDSKRGRIAGD